MHQGQLVAQYRENMGQTQEWLAEELGVHIRTVIRLESTAMIRNVSRRWFLVGLLGIPASELGLAGEPPWSKKARLPLNDDILTFYESEIEIRWQLYKASGPNLASLGIHSWVTQVEQLVKETNGTPWQRRSLAVLSMSYQLKGSIFRDSCNYVQAHACFQKAYQAAQESKMEEYRVAVLLRDGMVFMAEKRPMEAVKNFTGALEAIEGAPFPRLRGKLLQSRAEAYALAQRSDDCWANIGLAEHMIGREEKGVERSQVIFSPSSIVLWKGLNAQLLHDDERALRLFEKGLADQDPSRAADAGTRARFLSRKAEVHYSLGQIQESIASAQQAFHLATSIGKNSTIERVQNHYILLTQSKWRNEKGLRTLGVSIQQYHGI